MRAARSKNRASLRFDIQIPNFLLHYQTGTTGPALFFIRFLRSLAPRQNRCRTCQLCVRSALASPGRPHKTIRRRRGECRFFQGNPAISSSTWRGLACPEFALAWWPRVDDGPLEKVGVMPLSRDPLVSHHHGVAKAIASALSVAS